MKPPLTYNLRDNNAAVFGQMDPEKWGDTTLSWYISPHSYQKP
jgi:hypothetical protein